MNESESTNKTMNEPKINEVWKTKSNNIVLIVEVHTDNWPREERRPEEPKLGFLWFDTVDRTFSVSEIHTRMAEKISNNPQDFWNALPPME